MFQEAVTFELEEGRSLWSVGAGEYADAIFEGLCSNLRPTEVDKIFRKTVIQMLNIEQEAFEKSDKALKELEE